MEKNIEIGLLYEFYGKLLTEKQSYIINAYYNDDYSLSEIADELDITRQGVRKQLKDAEQTLFNLEDKLELLNKFLDNKKELEKIYKDIVDLEIKYNDETISILKDKLIKLI